MESSFDIIDNNILILHFDELEKYQQVAWDRESGKVEA